MNWIINNATSLVSGAFFLIIFLGGWLIGLERRFAEMSKSNALTKQRVDELDRESQTTRATLHDIRNFMARHDAHAQHAREWRERLDKKLDRLDNRINNIKGGHENE